MWPGAAARPTSRSQSARASARHPSSTCPQYARPAQLRATGRVVAGVGAAGTRETFVDGGVRVTSARLGGFVVNELDFPPAHRMELDPEDGYVAVVLEGACEKT